MHIYIVFINLIYIDILNTYVISVKHLKITLLTFRSYLKNMVIKNIKLNYN